MTAESPSRGGSAAATCPVCQGTFTASANKLFCGKLCRDTAYRRRKQSPPRPAVKLPADPSRRSVTVYECDGCGERSLGSQRCEECRTFMRKLGLGGPCPHCDELVTVTELLQEEVVSGGIK